MSNRLHSTAILASLALFFVATPDVASAQTKPFNQYEEQLAGAGKVHELNQTAAGERVSLFDGSTQFESVDLDVPGNSKLKVEFRRNYVVEPNKLVWGKALGDWDLDLPRLYGVFRAGDRWPVATPGHYDRCSSQKRPPTVASGNLKGLFGPSEYWTGNYLHIPGERDEQLLNWNSTLNSAAPQGGTYKWATRTNWFFSCLSPLKSTDTPGEGFLAISPSGVKYYFDQMIFRSVSGGLLKLQNTPIFQEPGDDLNQLGWNGSQVTSSLYPDLSRWEAWLVPTRVEDVHGNWVTYAYTNDGKLTSITSSDGRSISVNYNTNGTIRSVSDGARTIVYTYSSSNSLTKVALPDGSAWSLNLSSLSTLQIQPFQRSTTCDTEASKTLSGTPSGWIKHPSGATVEFTFALNRHGKSNVPKECIQEGTQLAEARFKPFHDSLGLAIKRVSGPGLSTQVWQYTYFGHHGSWRSTCQAQGCLGEKQVIVTTPNGEQKAYTFGTNFGANYGLLLREETKSAQGSVHRSVSRDYSVVATQQSGARRIGQSLVTRDDTLFTEYRTPEFKITILQDGITFHRVAQEFDDFGNPTVSTSSSTLGFTRTSKSLYLNITSKWIVGLLTSEQDTNSSSYIREASYDLNTGNLITSKKFGLIDSQYSYNADGTVASTTDGRGFITRTKGWYRGVPRTVEFPDGTTISAVVSPIGLATAVTDQNGFTTSYAYDGMGRLVSITPPSGDSTPWIGTTINFVPVSETEYGIASGHWRRTESKGDYRKVTYYDALWRPVLEREFDNANASATQRFRGWKYDHEGRNTFDGYPLSTATSIASFGSNGTTTTYDALGRPAAVSRASELGTLTTNYSYLSGFKTRITNPRGYSTTTSYQAFDTPDTSRPIMIEAPEGVTTTIARDTFGKPTALTRSGIHAGSAVSATRRYVYDGYQRLCKRIEPETGATFFDYDGNGNIVWSAEGTTLTTLACDRTAVASNVKVLRSFDSMNRPTLVDYPGTTADISYTYEADGALRLLSSGGSTWTYAYNRRRQPTNETLVFDGRSFGMTRTYNSLGYQVKQGYPVGTEVVYTLNALGQATRISSTTDYASNITYYPSGAIKSFRYGNGIVRIMTPNARGLPMRTQEILPNASTLLDDNYAYDKNGNVADITDPVGSNSRGMGYDALDRLTTTVAPGLWGTASYAYDPLDNLRSADLGSRQYRYVYNTVANRLDRIQNASGVLQFAVGYNAQGDVTSKGTAGYSFDTAHRLLAVNGVASYAYDGHGRRIKETPAGGAAQYQVYDQGGKRVLTESGGSGVRLVYLGNTLVGLDAFSGPTLGARTFLHTDALGSVVVRTDQNAGVVRRLQYEPYGAAWGGAIDGIGYTGHDMDLNSGLTYMQQRYYDPSIGRFLSVDPVAADPVNGGNFNRYWYANNSPYRFTDPDGRHASQKGFYVHQRATYDVIGKNLPLTESRILSRSHVTADAQQFQGSDSAYRHAMRNGYQTATEARMEANKFVRSQFQKAWTAESRSESLKEFGLALHALQDSTSPAHGGFQRWTGRETVGEEIAHVSKELTNPGRGSQLYQATETAWTWYNEGKLPEGDLFRWGTD